MPRTKRNPWFALILAAALAAGASPAHAAFGWSRSLSPAAEEARDFFSRPFSRMWDWLASVWAENGVDIDPNGNPRGPGGTAPGTAPEIEDGTGAADGPLEQ